MRRDYQIANKVVKECHFDSNMDKKQFYIDKAKVGDFERILQISGGIYNGYDYVPHVFKNWVLEEEENENQRRNLGES